MFVLSNFISALGDLVNIVLTVFYWLILIRAVISWVSADPFNPIVQFLHRTTEPVLEPIRRLLPPMAFDLSPLIAFFAIIFLKQFLVRTLYDIAVRVQA
jgi:YggT family protein